MYKHINSTSCIRALGRCCAVAIVAFLGGCSSVEKTTNTTAIGCGQDNALPIEVHSIAHLGCVDGSTTLEPAHPFLWGKINFDQVRISATDVFGSNAKNQDARNFRSIQVKKLTSMELESIMRDEDSYMKRVFAGRFFRGLPYSWGYQITAITNNNSILILQLAFEREPNGRPVGGRGIGQICNPTCYSIEPFGIGFPFNAVFPAK